MNPTEDEAGRPESSEVAQAVARLYEVAGGLVLGSLAERFRLSPRDAEELLYLAGIHAVTQDVRNRDAWAVAFACNGARALRRRQDQGTGAPPPDITVEEIEALRGVVLVGKALATIPKNGRDALRLRFREQRSDAEIAEQLDVSQKYAQTLVFKSLQRLRASSMSARAEEEERD